LSSGYRINKSADDAAGLAISEGYKSTIRSMSQAQRNANDGISLIQTAEGGMNEISNILIRLRELATQSASDTISNVERAYTNREYTQLVDEVDRIANSAEFNGLKIFGGSDKNNGMEEITVHVGPGDGTEPNRDTISINMANLALNAAETLGLGKEGEIGPVAGESFTREQAAEKLTVVDAAISRISDMRANLGAKQSRMTSAVSNLSIQLENLQSANSRVRDVDFAAETARFTQTKILSQAGISVLTQANQAPEMALGLLR
jgi:flagellin